MKSKSFFRPSVLTSIFFLYCIFIGTWESSWAFTTKPLNERKTALSTHAERTKVIVTGAAGRTGKLVLHKLLSLKDRYEPLAIVRTGKSAKQLQKEFKDLSSDQVLVYDITNTQAETTNNGPNPFRGYQKLVICTSAKPQISFWSLIKAFFFKLFGKVVRPTFTFPNGQPYYVDWLGTKQQVDVAKASGTINQVVMVSSMGGTQPDNFLNTIGKVEGDEKSGNILLWKRKGEEYLINSGLPYTIVHPGGLLDKPGGVNQVVMEFDDEAVKETRKKRPSIPRADVAEVCIQALDDSNALRRSFDIYAEPFPEEVAEKKMNWKDFFSKRGNNKY